MSSILLGLSLIAGLGYGYWLMGRLDRFVDGTSQKKIAPAALRRLLAMAGRHGAGIRNRLRKSGERDVQALYMMPATSGNSTGD